MNEEIKIFGQGTRMVGILSRPRNPGNRPAVLLWDVGLSHRVGPQRQNVELARLLGGLGFTCLRFDLSGLGDSTHRSGDLDQEQREVADIRDAMDFMTAVTGIDRFILIGFCSGAHSAHPTAVADPRVCGLVMIDGYGYPTWKFRCLYYLHRLLSPRRWWHHLKMRWEARRMPHQPGSFFRAFPRREVVAKDLNKLVKRGVELFYIYTGGIGDYYNYRRQFRDMFPEVAFGAQLSLGFYRKADHLFTALEQKRRYMQDICRWALHKFGKELDETGAPAKPAEFLRQAVLPAYPPHHAPDASSDTASETKPRSCHSTSP